MHTVFKHVKVHFRCCQRSFCPIYLFIIRVIVNGASIVCECLSSNIHEKDYRQCFQLSIVPYLHIFNKRVIVNIAFVRCERLNLYIYWEEYCQCCQRSLCHIYKIIEMSLLMLLALFVSAFVFSLRKPIIQGNRLTDCYGTWGFLKAHLTINMGI